MSNDKTNDYIFGMGHLQTLKTQNKIKSPFNVFSNAEIVESFLNN